MKIGKLNIPIGREQISTFNLSNNIIATGEMGQLIPLRQIECVPGDKFTLDIQMFTRTAPLVCPTYGSVKFTTRAFFVPARLCMNHWKEFISGMPYVIDNEYFDPEVPYITLYELTELFRLTDNGLITEVASTAPFDIEFRDSSGAVRGYGKLTPKGRYWLKLLNALGYRWNFILKNTSATTWVQEDIRFSLLPLLAFLRVYMDFYLPSQYLTGSYVKQYFDGLVYESHTHDEMIGQLYEVLNSVQLTYDDDYFTTAWRYPLSVLRNSTEVIRIPQASTVLTSQSQNLVIEGSPYGAYGYDNSEEEPNNFGVMMARSLANFLIRNNLAGQRAVEQVLARFGVKIPELEFQRSVCFGKSVSSLEIMDVTNTAESENYKLGSFGAKAIGFDQGKSMYFECKEHGYIIICTSIMPETSMGWQGFDRNLCHLDKFDFYTPEFDGKYMNPILSGELLCDYKGLKRSSSDQDDYQDYINNNNRPTSVFGFCPVYQEYKLAKDNVIGDFNVNTLNQGLDAYHLFRDYYPNSATLAQNSDLIYFNSEQYNRIFNVTDTEEDHFYMIYRLRVKAQRPMKNLSESMPFDDNDIEHRRSVSMSANGSQFNN